MMDRKTYYVSVANGDIIKEAGAADFQFEIQATVDELRELEELFEEEEEADSDSAARAITPYKEYHLDDENDRYDGSLKAIYGMLHKLGTPETKSHIESMHVLSQ